MNRSFVCYQAWRLMFIRMKQMYTNSVLIQITDNNSYVPVHSILNLFFIYALKYPMSVFEFRLERRRGRS